MRRIDASAMAFMAVVLFALSCFGGCEAQKLIQDEVITLKRAAKKLKANWDFSIDPCRWNAIWPGSSKYIVRNVSCTCDPICHVTVIELKGQNLTGDLPSELANLTKLNILELTQNYLGGSIPVSWASLPLTQLHLGGNRISGRIPDEIGNMSTLETLELDSNQLEGLIPATLGKLTKLTRLFLTSNNFSGELPGSLGNLKNMSYFLIDGNPISGKIPSFIGNWTKLQRLDIQGTSLEGPFPLIFADLTSITELRVSDIRGINEFPPLQNLTSMKQLIFRNLSISGQIPDYIGDMKQLFLLDLSFNNLTGPIPQSFDSLTSSINHMFLGNNQLTGTIPSWILSSNKNLDVSFNNFNGSPAPFSCSQGNVNLVSSYSYSDSNTIAPCLKRNLPCSGKRENYNFFINCGGPKVTVDGNEYEDDSSPNGESRFYSDNVKWASSSTGFFTDNISPNYIIAANNASLLNISNPELYKTARLSPVSLKYYGLCLQKGNYNVSLHFAEIIFTNDQTFSSAGRRIFDVSIQSKYTLGLLVRAGLTDTRTVETLLELNTKLSPTDGVLFRRLYPVQRGGWLFDISYLHPVIQHAVHGVSQFFSAPCSLHWAAVLRILRYLCGTLHRSLFSSSSQLT